MRDLGRYLQLRELLKCYEPSHQELREFGIKYKNLSKDPLKILKKWIRENLFRIKNIKELKNFEEIMGKSDWVGYIVAIFFGLITSLGLLSYSGKEPVNVVYFMFFAFLLPLLSGLLTLYSLFGANNPKWNLHKLFTSFIWQKIYLYLKKEKNLDTSQFALPQKLVNLKIVEFSIKFSLVFYISFALSLLLMVIGEDIAFAWSSTLKISVEDFHSIITTIAMPWWFLESAIPSQELINASHYYRLGGEIDPNLLKNASTLGEWWKFLFMSVLVYGIIFRLILLFFAKRKLKKTLKDEMLSLGGVQEILFKITTPLITTQTKNDEKPLIYKNLPKLEDIKEPKIFKKRLLIGIGWGFNSGEVEPLLEIFNIKISTLFEAGGAKSIDEDTALINNIKDDVIIFIKSWEAPTMDFFDFVEELLKKDIKVAIYPVGLQSNGFLAKSEDIKIWQDKLLSLNIKIKIREPSDG